MKEKEKDFDTLASDILIELYNDIKQHEQVVEKDLTAAERRRMSDSDFALPGEGEGPEGKQAGAYPINDEEHARLALSMVAQHGTPEEKKKVRAAVYKKYPNLNPKNKKRED